jgi:hypothetical protein
VGGLEGGRGAARARPTFLPRSRLKKNSSSGKRKFGSSVFLVLNQFIFFFLSLLPCFFTECGFLSLWRKILTKKEIRERYEITEKEGIMVKI